MLWFRVNFSLAMPRSEAEGSSSDSDDDSLVALSDLGSPCRDDARPSADPASDAAVLASERGQVEPDRDVYLAKRASFVEESAKLLCWAHLERALRRSDSTPKQVAAQMREYRKRHWRDTSRDLLTDVCASLSAEPRRDLEHMVAAMRDGLLHTLQSKRSIRQEVPRLGSQAHNPAEVVEGRFIVQSAVH